MGVYFMILFFVWKLLSTNAFDICDENNGNIQINEAFRWGKNLVILGENVETNQSHRFLVNDFNYDRSNRKFSFKGMAPLPEDQWNTDIRLAFTVDYPNLGERLIQVELGERDYIKQFMPFMVKLDENGAILSKDSNITINIYKCGSKPEPMNLCTLFGKFPQEYLEDNMFSVSPFPPPIGGLPPRFMVYYRELPVNRRKCWDCFKIKRYVMIGRNATYGSGTEHLTEFNWAIDNTTRETCRDMRGLIINASLSLSDAYEDSGQIWSFLWIEFFGTQYKLYRIFIDKKTHTFLEDFNKIDSGPIAKIFKCKQPITTPPTTQSDDTTIGGSDDKSKVTDKHTDGPKSTEKLMTKSPFDDLTPKDRITSPSPKGSSSLPVILIIVFILLIILIIGGVVWFLMSKRGAYQVVGGGGATAPKSPPAPPPPPTPLSSPPTPPAVTTSTNSPAVTPTSPPGAVLSIPDAEVTPTPSDTKTVISAQTAQPSP